MVDRGRDWLTLPATVHPDAIVLTHAHLDHAGGLAGGADCPVFATRETLELLARWPIAARRIVEPRVPFRLGALRFEAFALEHSLRAPTVGYRIATSRGAVFYCPDVALIRERHAALGGLALYIGDGASVLRSMVRRVGAHSIGHAPIRDQLDWCAAEGVRSAIFTHCGSGIVRSPGREASALVHKLGEKHSVAARLAFDGLSLPLP